MKNDHNQKECWHCNRNHVFMTAKCVSDLTGKPLKALYNNEGRHFRIVKDGGVFFHRAQVEAHVQVVIEKGRCKGECAAVFEGKEFPALPINKPAQLEPAKAVSFDRLNELKKQLYSTMGEVVEEIGRLEAELGLQRK